MAPEMARVVYPGRMYGGPFARSAFVCPCGTSDPAWFLRVDREANACEDGLYVLCWTCGRIFTADGVVVRSRTRWEVDRWETA